MDNNQTAFITGSHGFVARHLMPFLTKKGVTIFQVDRNILYDPIKLKDAFRQYNPTYIFHLAAYGNMAHHTDDEQTFQANTQVLWNLLRATKDIPYQAFINISSSAVILENLTIYAATKLSGEYICEAYGTKYHKPIISVRPYSLYGTGEANHRFIPTVFRSCMENETMTLAPAAVHDWLYIDDFVQAIWETSQEANELTHETIGIGTGVATSNEKIVSMIEKLTGKKANITERREMRQFDTDTWKATDEEALDIYIDLEEGLKRYYDYYQHRQ